MTRATQVNRRIEGWFLENQVKTSENELRKHEGED
jgi:hypothetical protein